MGGGWSHEYVAGDGAQIRRRGTVASSTPASGCHCCCRPPPQQRAACCWRGARPGRAGAHTGGRNGRGSRRGRGARADSCPAVQQSSAGTWCTAASTRAKFCMTHRSDTASEREKKRPLPRGPRTARAGWRKGRGLHLSHGRAPRQPRGGRGAVRRRRERAIPGLNRPREQRQEPHEHTQRARAFSRGTRHRHRGRGLVAWRRHR